MFLLLVIAALAVGCNGKAQIPDNSPEGRILGGELTTIKAHPYQVSLQTLGLFHKCGGTIISKYYVVTAAHCVKSYFPSTQKLFLRIRSGTSYKVRGGSVHTIDKIIIHENYRVSRSGTPFNDIALIRVKKPFKLNATRQLAPLYRSNEGIRAGTLAVVTGWGRTGSTSIFSSSQLHKVNVPIVEKDKCNAAYGYKEDVGEGKICAGWLGVSGKDSCQGDSGGPLTINGQLVGVVSYGNGCGEPNYPGIYTDVSYYNHWIVKNAGLSNY